MEYITLKNSFLNVSRICFGGCQIGGYGWGKTLDSDLINAIHSALDSGINFFDNADVYGLGKSEETLGKALKGKRNKSIIATKFGVRVENGKTFYDNSSKWINKAVQESLRRLDTDYIDLYQIHYRDYYINLNDVVESLENLKKKGFIRYYGLSNIYMRDIKEINPHKGKFTSFQDEYSLATRKNENDIIDLSEKLNLSPLTWGSLGQGVLTGKYHIDTKFETNDRRSKEIYINFHGEKLKRNLEIVNLMRKISKETGKSVPSIAIRFILDHIKRSVVIVGIKNPSQLLSNVEAVDWRLSNEQIKELLTISNETLE